MLARGHSYSDKNPSINIIGRNFKNFNNFFEFVKKIFVEGDIFYILYKLYNIYVILWKINSRFPSANIRSERKLHKT